MEMLTELFNQKRMDKCAETFRQILNHWLAHSFECRIVADEPLEGKTLDELGKMYLSVGVGENLTELPLLDTLIVIQMLADHNRKQTQRKGNSETYTVKTQFSQDEVFA